MLGGVGGGVGVGCIIDGGVGSSIASIEGNIKDGIILAGSFVCAITMLPFFDLANALKIFGKSWISLILVLCASNPNPPITFLFACVAKLKTLSPLGVLTIPRVAGKNGSWTLFIFACNKLKLFTSIAFAPSIVICFPFTADILSTPPSFNTFAISLITALGFLVVNKSISSGFLENPLICVLWATDPPTTISSLFSKRYFSKIFDDLPFNLPTSPNLICLISGWADVNSFALASKSNAFCLCVGVSFANCSCLTAFLCDSCLTFPPPNNGANKINIAVPPFSCGVKSLNAWTNLFGFSTKSSCPTCFLVSSIVNALAVSTTFSAAVANPPPRANGKDIKPLIASWTLPPIIPLSDEGFPSPPVKIEAKTSILLNPSLSWNLFCLSLCDFIAFLSSLNFSGSVSITSFGFIFGGSTALSTSNLLTFAILFSSVNLNFLAVGSSLTKTFPNSFLCASSVKSTALLKSFSSFVISFFGSPNLILLFSCKSAISFSFCFDLDLNVSPPTNAPFSNFASLNSFPSLKNLSVLDSLPKVMVFCGTTSLCPPDLLAVAKVASLTNLPSWNVKTLLENVPLSISFLILDWIKLSGFDLIFVIPFSFSISKPSLEKVCSPILNSFSVCINFLFCSNSAILFCSVLCCASLNCCVVCGNLLLASSFLLRIDGNSLSVLLLNASAFVTIILLFFY